MDINCSEMVEGVWFEAKDREISDILLRVASGDRTKSERLGYGDAECASPPITRYSARFSTVMSASLFPSSSTTSAS
ncbi:MAG: Galactarate dehydratase [Xanthobacteraceae bacterium]|nr:Galactarate dehydratase [Xanthobacteraceae bacterium]